MVLRLQTIFHELRICLIYISSQKPLTLPYTTSYYKSVTLRHEECHRHVRVLRGGSWNNNNWNNLRVANRNNNNPTNTNNNIGFRCVSQHFSIFDAGVRKPDHLAERVSRSPDGVPVLDIIVQPNTKTVPGRLVGDERWRGTFEDRTLM